MIRRPAADPAASFDPLDPWSADDDPPFQALLGPLLRHQVGIVLLVALGGFLGLCYAVLLPNEFVSTAKLMVRFGKRETATTDSALQGDDGSGYKPSLEDLQNELHLLRNPALFQEVADRLGPEAVLAPYDPARMDGPETPWHVALLHRVQKAYFALGASSEAADASEHEKGLRRLQAALALEASMEMVAEGQSNIVAISYRANDPEAAQRVVRAFLVAASQAHQQTFSPQNSFEFLKQQAEQAARDAREAATALAKCKEEANVFDLALEKQELVAKIEGLESQIAANRLEAIALRSRAAFYEKKVQEGPGVLNPGWQSQQLLVASLEDEVRELLVNYKETSDKVKVKRAQIQSAQTELARIPKYLEGADEPPVARVAADGSAMTEQEHWAIAYGNTLADLAALEGTLSEDEQRHTTLSKSLRDKLNVEPALIALETDTEIKLATAKEFARLLQGAQVSVALDAANLSNLRVIQEPTLPYQKSGPKRPKYLLLGMMGFGVVGAVWAYLLAALDRRIREPRDLRRLGVPSIGTMPGARR